MISAAKLYQVLQKSQGGKIKKMENFGKTGNLPGHIVKPFPA